MKLKEVEKLANELINEHLNWHFEFKENRSQMLGRAEYATKTIYLSKNYVENNSIELIKDTILHEIAHALTPKAGHNAQWVKMAKELGVKNPKSTKEAIVTNSKYYTICSHCGEIYTKNRLTQKNKNVNCGHCVKKMLCTKNSQGYILYCPDCEREYLIKRKTRDYYVCICQNKYRLKWIENLVKE